MRTVYLEEKETRLRPTLSLLNEINAYLTHWLPQCKANNNVYPLRYAHLKVNMTHNPIIQCKQFYVRVFSTV